MQVICPSIFIIDPDIRTKPINGKDIFRPDGFKVLQAEKLTRIKEIVSQTTTGQEIYVRLLCCYRMKDLAETYCIHRRVDGAKKSVCSDESGIKTRFTHFHIQGRMKELHCSDYFLAFLEGSDLYSSTKILVQELLSLLAWFEIKSKKVFLNVFTFGEPIYGTSNENYLEELLYSARVQTRNINIEYKITHISKTREEILHIFLKNNYLHFNPS